MEKLLEQRRNALLVALAVVVVLVVGGRLLARTGAPREARPATIVPLSPKRAQRPAIVVDVAGGVWRPGVYRFLEGARVVDAVARAGGAKPKALLSQLNLAERLADGEQVVVPLQGGQVSAVASAPESSGPVHLGTATVEQLDALPGVGPVTAQRIVDYRSEHGGFKSVAELDAVPGIGPARFAQLRELVAP
jgi:competence protein ComEA